MAKKMGGGGYQTKATKTSVDYTAGMQHIKPGSAGPDKVKSNASAQHTPVPGYSKTDVTTSLDYTAGMGNQKPGSCGPTIGGKRKHY